MTDYVDPASSGRAGAAEPPDANRRRRGVEAAPPVADASSGRRPRPELWLAVGLIIADQLSKAAVRAYIPLYDSVEVIPGLLNLTHALNTGAAFGFLDRLDFAYKTLVVACWRRRRSPPSSSTR